MAKHLTLALKTDTRLQQKMLKKLEKVVEMIDGSRRERIMQTLRCSRFMDEYIAFCSDPGKSNPVIFLEDF